MITVILDGRKMTSIEETHKLLKQALSLSEYYGENLDALWDELSTKSRPLSIKVTHTDEMDLFLGAYSEKLKELFREIGMYHKGISVEFKDDDL